MTYIADHINTIRAVDISWYGLIYFVTAITLLWRGFKQRQFIYWQPVGKTWRWPVIPGRIPAGIFFLFACHREWDTAFNRVRWGGGVKSAEQVNDLNSVVPLTIGCLFGVWWIVRLIRNDVGSVAPPRKKHDRIANATERLAAATEVIAEQAVAERTT